MRVDQAEAEARVVAKRVGESFPARLAASYGQSQAGNLAAALAFNAFLTMFPLILGSLAIVGLAVRDPARMTQVRDLLISGFPASTQDQLLHALNGVRESAGWMGLISLAGLLWAGTGLFAALEFSLAAIFGVPQRDMVRQRLMGLMMLLVLLAGAAISVALNVLAAFAAPARVAGPLAGAVVLAGFCLAVYRLVPQRTFNLRRLVPGAVLAGVLIELLNLAFPLYAHVSNGFDTYGRQFALFFVIAAWLYLVSQLILLGAVLTRMGAPAPDRRGLIAAPGPGPATPSAAASRNDPVGMTGPVNGPERTRAAERSHSRRGATLAYLAAAVLLLPGLSPFRRRRRPA